MSSNHGKEELPPPPSYEECMQQQQQEDVLNRHSDQRHSPHYQSCPQSDSEYFSSRHVCQEFQDQSFQGVSIQPSSHYNQPRQYNQTSHQCDAAYSKHVPNEHVVVLTEPIRQSFSESNRPPDYILPAVLACCCCFWPTGLCAVAAAFQAYFAGKNIDTEEDLARAHAKSATARNLTAVTVILGIMSIGIVFFSKMMIGGIDL